MRKLLPLSRFALVFLTLGCSYAQDGDSYMGRVPTQRLALIVGNDDYGQRSLPSVKADREQMAQVLRNLGFKVTVAVNVMSHADLKENYLRPFARSIKSGDFAVFYFSGHGFNYNGSGYLLPTEYPEKTPASQVDYVFGNTGSITNFLRDRKPGLLYVILDACRNFALPGIYDDQKGDQPNIIPKSLGLPKPVIASSSSVETAFASEEGAEAYGITDPGRPSLFTGALIGVLDQAKAPIDIDAVRKEVIIQVKFITDNKQQPWFSLSSAANVLWNEDEEIRAQHRSLWQSVLLSPDRRSVFRFLLQYPTSDYAAAAARWLDNHPESAQPAPPRSRALVLMSAVPGFAADIAWEALGSRQGGQDGSPVSAKIPKFEAALVAATSTQSLVASDLDRIKSSLQSIAAAGNSPSARLAHREILGYTAKVTETISFARSTPSFDAPSFNARRNAVVQPDKPLGLTEVRTDSTGALWFLTGPNSGAKPGFVRPGGQDTLLTENLGFPGKELFIDARPRGLKSLVDESQVDRALAEVAAASRRVSWISIASPKVNCSEGERECERTKAMIDFRTRHLTYLLTQKGVLPTSISFATDVEDFADSEKLRLRLFVR